jgi:hypothetical protein
MKTNLLNWISQFSRYTLLLCAALYIVVYVLVALVRIRYPFELEWLEGNIVVHVSRIFSGDKLYVSPSLDFIPYPYNPLYYFLSALVSKVVGVGLFPLRLVSFLSSLGCFYFIYLIVQRETNNSFAGILASSLFAATYKKSGTWFDIARVDSLFLLFLLLALYLIRFKSSWKSSVLTGVVISLSILTKQTALVIIIPIMIYCVIASPRHSLFFIGSIVTLSGISILFLSYIHGGWYIYYAYLLPNKIPIMKRFLYQFWRHDIVLPLAIALGMSILYLFCQVSNFTNMNCLYYLFVAVGMVGGSWLARLHWGAALNVLFPAYAIISILFGLAVHTAFEFVQVESRLNRELGEIYIYTICMLQFASLIYNPFRVIPTPNDLQRGREVINHIARFKGEVYVPYHGYLAVLAGKKSYAQISAMHDVFWADEEQGKLELLNNIRQVLQQRQFSAIILDQENGDRLKKYDVEAYNRIQPFFNTIRQYYVKQKEISFSPDSRRTIISKMYRPWFVYVPKEHTMELLQR